MLFADCIEPGQNLLGIMEALSQKLEHPFALHVTKYTLKSVLICTGIYGMGIGIYYSSQKNYRRG